MILQTIIGTSCGLRDIDQLTDHERNMDQVDIGMDSNKQLSDTATESVSSALALLDELPQLPAAVHQLFEALSDEDIDRHRLASAIDQCPSLSAKLVGLANSAYFGQASHINGVSDAIFVIGFRSSG